MTRAETAGQEFLQTKYMRMNSRPNAARLKTKTFARCTTITKLFALLRHMIFDECFAEYSP